MGKEWGIGCIFREKGLYFGNFLFHKFTNRLKIISEFAIPYFYHPAF